MFTLTRGAVPGSLARSWPLSPRRPDVESPPTPAAAWLSRSLLLPSNPPQRPATSPLPAFAPWRETNDADHTAPPLDS